MTANSCSACLPTTWRLQGIALLSQKTETEATAKNAAKWVCFLPLRCHRVQSLLHRSCNRPYQAVLRCIMKCTHLSRQIAIIDATAHHRSVVQIVCPLHAAATTDKRIVCRHRRRVAFCQCYTRFCPGASDRVAFYNCTATTSYRPATHPAALVAAPAVPPRTNANAQQ